MARLAPLWQQNNSYSAQVDRQLIAALYPAGAAWGAVPSAAANTLNMNIPAGRAAVPMTSDGTVQLCRWDATEVVALNAGPAAGTSRIDLIVVNARDSAISGTNDDFQIVVVTGTAAASPVPPNPLPNSYTLCSVLVPASVANLNTATVTDLRSVGLAVPRSAEYNLASDTDVTTTAFATVLSGAFTPSGSRVRADLSCTGFTAAVTSPRTTFQITNGAGQTKWICAPGSPVAASAIFAGGSAVFSGLVPGQSYTFAVQVASGAGTFRMRAGTQPTLENMRLVLSDA
jgi:hypothetical protein